MKTGEGYRKRQNRVNLGRQSGRRKRAALGDTMGPASPGRWKKNLAEAWMLRRKTLRRQSRNRVLSECGRGSFPRPQGPSEDLNRPLRPQGNSRRPHAKEPRKSVYLVRKESKSLGAMRCALTSIRGIPYGFRRRCGVRRLRAYGRRQIAHDSGRRESPDRMEARGPSCTRFRLVPMSGNQRRSQ